MMGLFEAAQRWGHEVLKLPLPKICYTYLKMVKLGKTIPYLKKIKISHYTRLAFCWRQYFSPEISNFCYIVKYNKKVFWYKGYDVIISVPYVISKVLLRDSDFIVNLIVWPKFADSSVREATITSIYKRFWPKTNFRRDGLGLSSKIWDW